MLAVKSFRLAKQRLAGTLSVEERAHLARELFLRTVSTVAAADVPHVVVVTSEPEATEVARSRGWSAIPDPGKDHSAAVAAAATWLANEHRQRLATLATDLPLLSADDVRRLVAAAEDRALTIATNLSGTGTNALAVPLLDFPFAFGPHSLARHAAAARERGLPVRILHSAGLAFDLDEPDDLQRARVSVGGPCQPDP